MKRLPMSEQTYILMVLPVKACSMTFPSVVRKSFFTFAVVAGLITKGTML